MTTEGIGDHPKEECGVLGVYAPEQDAARIAFFGLFALQHRGQESAGIAVSDGQTITVVKDMGLVTQVFDERNLASLHGHIAIGHNRYSTTGSSSWRNAQPVYRSVGEAGFALGHNGNLTNTPELAVRLREVAHDLTSGSHSLATSDTDVLTGLIAAAATGDLVDAAAQVLPTVLGAYSLVFCDESTLYAARDPQGIRPLALGRMPVAGC